VVDSGRPGPRISIVTPSFNQAQFLERTLRSVLEQGYPDLEYIVMDGGSSDESPRIIERYADRLAHWQSGPDGGQSAAINAGWRRATGEIVGWLNSDDYLLPGTLDLVAQFMRDHPDASAVYGQVDLVSAEGRALGRIGEPFSRRILLFSRTVVPQPAAFVRRAALDRAGPLDEGLQFTMDLDLWFRLARVGPLRFVPRPLAAATVHPEAKTFRDRDPMARERQMVRLRYARGPERLVVRAQPMASRAYQVLPQSVRERADLLRPRRARADRIDGARR